MNLHALVSPLIGAVNPNQQVAIRVSTGATTNPDGSPALEYATPGAITASIGGTFTASIPDPVNAPTTLNVSAVLTGSLQVGDLVSGTDGASNSLPAGCTILSQLSGTPGGVGTYQLSQGATLGSTTVTAASTTLNVSAVAGGVLQPGQTLSDAGALLPGTMIAAQISGNQGGAGLYSISRQQTVASEAMATALVLTAQVQPLGSGDVRHADALNIQGSRRAIYLTGQINGAIRVGLKGGDLVQLADGTNWLVTESLEPFYSTAGWTKALLTLQAGA